MQFCSSHELTALADPTVSGLIISDSLMGLLLINFFYLNITIHFSSCGV